MFFFLPKNLPEIKFVCFAEQSINNNKYILK